MPDSHTSSRLIEYCWDSLFQLHKTLRELNKLNAECLEFPYSVSNHKLSQVVAFDLELWRQAAEHARCLAAHKRNGQERRSLLEIANAYETIASYENPSDCGATNEQDAQA